MTLPRVTVVVIVYNDAGRLPAAVGSAVAQRGVDVDVVVVDDASTDATAEVAASLAARHPGVVRHVRLPENSGGCSRPRNVGIDHAHGDYVMFLDSDDTLPVDAARVLVGAMEDADADLAAGLCARVHVNQGGRADPWYPWFYRERLVLQSISDNPDLLYDTLSTNKCYRRSFLAEHGLRFPEGVHYEDLLFSATAYLRARRLALVPDLVYRWQVVDDAETPSITNRRSELGNFRDRLAMLRRIDDMFAAAGAADLRIAEQMKFLAHDLLLYLPDLPYRDAASRRALLGLAREHLERFAPEAFARADRVQAITAWLILQDDEEALRHAIDFVVHGRKLSTRLVSRDGRVYWCDRHLDTAAGRAALDVTDLGFDTVPLSELDLYDEVTADVAGTRLSLRGRIVNQLDRIPADAPLALEIVAAPRRGRGRRALRVPASVTHAGADLEWHAVVDLARLPAVGVVDPVWDLRARLTVGDVVNIGRLSVTSARWDGVAVPVRPRLGRLAADRLELLVTPHADLALQFRPGTRTAVAVHEAAQRIAAAPLTGRVSSLARRVGIAVRQPAHPRVRGALFRRTLVHLPAARELVVFESERGARCSGSPRAVYDEVRRRGIGLRALWVHDGDPARCPPDARPVRRGGAAYFTALARAAAWVDDGSIPVEAAKRAGATYVQTEIEGAVTGGMPGPTRRPPERLAVRRGARRWDVVVLRGPRDDVLLSPVWRPHATVVRDGYPRTDPLVAPTPDDLARVARLRASLELGQRPVVLHVPDCDEPAFVPDGRSVPGDAVLLWRGAAPANAEVGAPVGAVDVSAVDDLTSLVLLADVVVTDHHPVLLDAPLASRPVVVVGCVHARGAPLARVTPREPLPEPLAPPLVWTADALAACLGDLGALAQEEAVVLRALADAYAPEATGAAAARVVDVLVDRLGMSGR